MRFQTRTQIHLKIKATFNILKFQKVSMKYKKAKNLDRTKCILMKHLEHLLKIMKIQIITIMKITIKVWNSRTEKLRFRKNNSK